MNRRRIDRIIFSRLKATGGRTEYFLKYTAFIFDFDYTLADATYGIVSSANFALEKLRLDKKPVNDIRKTVGMTLKDTFKRLTSVDDDGQAELFVKYYKEKADEVMTENTALFPDTVEVLNKIKNTGFPTAIVTSKSNYRIRDVLEKYEITHLVDHIVGFEDVIEPKPSPEGLLKAISFLGARSSDVLYIGDSLIDSLTAKNAHVDFAAVTTGATLPSEFEVYPYKIIGASLSDIFRQLP